MSVLDPIERASEIVFGVLIAVSITGTLSVATAGRGGPESLLASAVGANLAWGLTDGVMYLMHAATERRRRITLLKRIRDARDEAEAHRIIAESLPEHLTAVTDAAAFEALRRRFVGMSLPPAGLRPADFAGAAGVFALVVLATLPVVLPFLLFDVPRLALRASNALALVTLFISGFALGRYTGGSTWLYGLGLTATGAALICVIIALGG